MAGSTAGTGGWGMAASPADVSAAKPRPASLALAVRTAAAGPVRGVPLSRAVVGVADDGTGRLDVVSTSLAARPNSAADSQYPRTASTGAPFCAEYAASRAR